jgi:NHLM bacteriocin system ABC transporter peptidase/ATP-binding protein
MAKAKSKPEKALVRVPTVLQMEAVECGAACLGMIMAFHGRFVPLEELRYACGVSRDGSKASNIIKAARNYGLKAKGFKMEPEALHTLPLPMIVFWNFNHFVVVEGFDAKGIFLNDPAAGPRKVTHEEFNESFTGVVLAFEIGSEFAKGGEKSNALKSLKSRLPGSESAIAFVVLASLGLAVPGLLMPSFSRIFIDYYLIQHLEDWLLPLFGAMAATALLKAFLTWLQQHHLLRFQTKLSLAASARFMWHILRLPAGFFGQRYAGEIGSRVALNDRMANLIAGDLATTLLNMLTMLIFALLMTQYDGVLTALGVGFAAINILVFRFVARKLADANQKLLLDRGKMTGVAMQSMQMIDNFKAAGMENLFFSRLIGHHAKVINDEQELARHRLFLQGVPLLLGGLAGAAILVVGGLRVMDGALSIGMLIAFQALMANFSAPVQSMVSLGGQLQEAEGCINRIDDVMRHPVAQEFAVGSGAEPKPSSPPGKLTGKIEIKDISFGFSPLDPPLIENFSLHLNPGDRVALVGGSGSGKSTLGRLIAGLYRHWEGEILYDGKSMDEVDRDTLRGSLSFVDQDIALFVGTVRDNFTLWDETIPEERIVEAARDAAIHDVIAERAEGYDSKMMEGGKNFSGGQRQRIELGRALAVNPTIMVLDEATSALDAATEKTVVDNLRRRGCTCVIVAHRLSTIRDCDEIIVLDHGKVVQRGTHEAMKDVEGPYKALIES